jgi:hypothetical protein
MKRVPSTGNPNKPALSRHSSNVTVRSNNANFLATYGATAPASSGVSGALEKVFGSSPPPNTRVGIVQSLYPLEPVDESGHLYYFEVKIIDRGAKGTIGVG